MSYSFFSRQNSETFDISHAFLQYGVAKLATFKNSLCFGPPCTSSQKKAVNNSGQK